MVKEAKRVTKNTKKRSVQNATEERKSIRNMKRRRYDIVVDDDKSSDEEEIESDEAYDQDNLYSFCFKIYRCGELWVQCDNCESWYHAECVPT